MLRETNALLRTLLLVGLVAIGGWWTVFLRGRLGEHERALGERERRIELLGVELEERDERIRGLGDELLEREARIAELDRALEEAELRLWLLKVDHRLARIEVLGQEGGGEDGEGVVTHLRFTELAPDGSALGEGRELSVQGEEIYLDALVIKFDDSFVEGGDLLRGTSVAVFRRIFGDGQRPSEGVAIDSGGPFPLTPESTEGISELQRELWQQFWEYANDPEAAAEKGVRAMHGESPYIKARPGATYRVELRSSGGLTIRPE